MSDHTKNIRPPVRTNTNRSWSSALENQQKRLDKEKFKDVLEVIENCKNSESSLNFEEHIVQQLKICQNRDVVRFMQKLDPIFQRLRVFLETISTIAQAAGPIAGFIWGVIQALCVVGSQFNGVMEQIGETIIEYTTILVQLQSYFELLSEPGQHDLMPQITAVIEAYAHFGVSALKFFRKRPIYNMVRVSFGAANNKLQKSQTRLGIKISEFDRAAELVFKTKALRRLPEDSHSPKIPERPAKLFSVDLSENHAFYGRDSVLDILHDKLFNPKASNQKSCVVHGIGGVGKTQVASQYTYRFQNDYDYVFWIRAGTDSELSNSVAEIADKLGLSKCPGRKRAIVEMVRSELENTEKAWLIVLDNAEDWETLNPILPKCSRGSILLTSQNPGLAKRTSSEHELHPLVLEDGARLLLNLIGGETAQNNANLSEATKIADELGGLPLAIAHVAGYISDTGMHITKFLELFHQNSKEVFARQCSTIHSEKALDVVWDIALKRLQDKNKDVYKLAQILSMMNPDGVPEDMLSADHSQPGLSFLHSSRRFEFENMVALLRDRHLVVREKGSLLMHRCLQRSIVHRLAKDSKTFEEIFQLCFTLIRKVFPRQSPILLPMNDQWTDWERYSSHVMTLRAVYVRFIQPTRIGVQHIDFAEMLSDASSYFWERNLFNQALQASETAEEICGEFSKTRGDLKKERAHIHTISASILCNYGIDKREESLYGFRRALKLRQEHINNCGPQNVTENDIVCYAHGWGDIGLSLLDYEYWDECIAVSSLAITMRKKLRGIDHKLMSCENERNIAICYAALGKFEEAKRMMPDIDKMRNDERFNASFYIFRFLWANILMAAGDLEDANRVLLEVLEDRIRTFGASARSTLDTYYMLAMVEEKRERFDIAENYLRKSLERPEEWLKVSRVRAYYRLEQLLTKTNCLNKVSESGLMEGVMEERKAFWKEQTQSLQDEYARVERFSDEENALYDHMVPMVAGRSTLGAFTPVAEVFQAKERHASLQKYLATKEDQSLSPIELAKIVKMKTSTWLLLGIRGVSKGLIETVVVASRAFCVGR